MKLILINENNTWSFIDIIDYEYKDWQNYVLPEEYKQYYMDKTRKPFFATVVELFDSKIYHVDINEQTLMPKDEYAGKYKYLCLTIIFDAANETYQKIIKTNKLEDIKTIFEKSISIHKSIPGLKDYNMILTIIFFIFAYTNIEGEDIIPYMLELYINVFYLYFKISNQDFYKCIQQIYTKIFNNW